MPDLRTGYQEIRLQMDGAIATITLDRPNKLNSLTDSLNAELADALEQLAARADVRVIVLEGEGRAFCAGFDVGQGGDRPPPTPQYWAHHFELGFRVLRQVWSQPQPVVCRVRGACLGGGFALSLACDLTYASRTAFFGDSEIKFGDGGHLFPILQWMVGMKKLNELQLTGRFVPAEEALSLGLVNEVVEEDRLDARVRQVAAHMCLLPDGTLRANKAATRRIYAAMGLDQLVATAQERCVLSLSTRTPSEFSALARSEGVSAALKWQKQRFAQVGAF